MAEHEIPIPLTAGSASAVLREAILGARRHGDITWLTNSDGEKAAAIVPPERVRRDETRSPEPEEPDEITRIAALLAALFQTVSREAYDYAEDAGMPPLDGVTSVAGNIERWLRGDG